MKFTTLIAFLLLPWAVVDGRSNSIAVSLGRESSLTALLLVAKRKNNNTFLVEDHKPNLTFDVPLLSILPNHRLLKNRRLM
jgi:hypothetical protein